MAATADVLVIKNAEGEDVTSRLNIKFVDGTIKVEPAKLTVTTPSASKPYDGDALTAEGKVVRLRERRGRHPQDHRRLRPTVGSSDERLRAGLGR